MLLSDAVLIHRNIRHTRTRRWAAVATTMAASLALSLALSLASRPLEAQSLSDLVNDLFTYSACARPLCLETEFEIQPTGPTNHGWHFLPENVPVNAAILETLGTSLSTFVSRVPQSAMAGGRTWSSDTEAASLGPLYAERAETLGAGRFSMGFETAVWRASTVAGTPAGALNFNFIHHGAIPDSLGTPRPSERDFIMASADIDFNVAVATIVLSGGITDYVDIGVTVPVVHSRLQATSSAQIVSFDPDYHHRFGSAEHGPILSAENSVSGSATGVGDVSARFKVNLSGGTPREGAPGQVGVGLLADVTFATGEEEDFLGLGYGRVRTLALISARFERFTPHLNAGYLLRGDPDVGDALVGSVGFDAELAPGLGVMAGLLGQLDFTDPDKRLLRPTLLPGVGDLTVDPWPGFGTSHYLMDLSLGLKMMMSPGMLLTTNVLLPIEDAGARPAAIWTLGLQGTFR